MTTNAKKQVIEILNERIEMLERLIERQSGISGILNAMANDLKRERLSAFKEVRDLLIDDQPTLNENQQEMLEWLQAYGDIDSGDKPFQTIFYISECFRTGRLDYSVLANLSKLNRKQQAQVLQVFSQWALEQEEE